MLIIFHDVAVPSYVCYFVIIIIIIIIIIITVNSCFALRIRTFISVTPH